MEVLPRVFMGESNGWKIEPFKVTEEDARAFNIGQLFSAGRYDDRSITAGSYVRLLNPNNDVMMSNTPAELRDHYDIINKASGSVLINGLGLGVVIEAILDQLHPWRRTTEAVTDITVIEKNGAVYEMVAPFYENEPRVTIHLADAFEWKPPRGKRYNAVWHDIWLRIDEDNLPQMHRLHRKYGRRADWQGSWGRSICEKMRKYYAY